jgi:hypothetical protein
MSLLLALRTSLDQGPIGGGSSEALAWQSDHDWEDRLMSDRMVFAMTPAPDRVPVARALGCPRCGSTCARLDGCPVCAGEAPCARCVFGSRVDEDEIHTALALEG